MTTVFDGPGTARHATESEILENIVEVRSICEQRDPLWIVIEEKAAMVRHRIKIMSEAHGFGLCLTRAEAAEMTMEYLGKRFKKILEHHKDEIERLYAA